MNLPEFLTRNTYGEIRLTGHRIGLYSVIRVLKEGQTPEEIHETFPTLSVELIRRVLDFYYENQAEVDAYVADVATELARQEAAHPPGPGLLKIRRLLEERRRAGTP
jgi:uncharacterized protein (DUF433 family)